MLMSIAKVTCASQVVLLASLLRDILPCASIVIVISTKPPKEYLEEKDKAIEEEPELETDDKVS